MFASYRSTDTCVRCGRAIDRGRAVVTSAGAVCPFCEEDDQPIPKRRWSLFFVAVAAVIALGGSGLGAWWLLRDTTVPWRVLVVASAESDTTEQFVRELLVESLRDIGFDAKPGPNDPPVDTEEPERAIEAARAIDAAYVVHIRIDVKEERPGIAAGRTFVVAEARTRVHPTSGDQHPADEHVATFGAEGVGRAGAVADVERAWVTVAASEVAGDLFAFERVRRAIEEAQSLDDIEAVADLRESLTAASGQRRTRARYEELCAEQDAGLVHESEAGEGGVTCLSGGCDEEYLFAVTADGQNAVVHVESPAIFVPFRSSPAPHEAETVERIELRPLDGSEARVLAWARNFYSYGSISRDGSTLAFVEAGDAFGLVVVDVESGERRVLRVVERPRRLLEPAVSHDGSLVLFYEDLGRFDEGDLEVVRTDGTSEPVHLGRGARRAGWVHLPLRPGEPPRALVAAIFERDDAVPDRLAHAVLIDPGDPSNHVRVGGEQHRVTQIAGDREGVLYLAWKDGGRCGVGTWSPGAESVSWTDAERCVERLSLTGDGMLVGTAATRDAGDSSNGDDEIVELDPATGTVRALTSDTRRDRYPATPLEGRRVVFERRGDSQFSRLHHSAVCFLER